MGNEQEAINQLVVDALVMISKELGQRRWSEPKHDIKGDPIRDKIYEIEQRFNLYSPE